MEPLLAILRINDAIVYFIYGQVFFVMGLAVLLQSRKYSRLDLARAIRLLGAFGTLHGMSEWASVFVPVQAEYLPPDAVTVLWIVHALVEAVSFACLFQFGIELLWPTLHIRWARLLPAEVLTLWVLLSFYVGVLSGTPRGEQVHESLLAADIVARYLLALPGALLVGAGLLHQAEAVELMEVPGMARYLRGAAASFFAYAVLAGTLVPPADFFPASVLNGGLLSGLLGVPVPVFRSLCGLAIAYFVVRALKMFDVEMDRMIEKMEREHMIAVERERIGRELHDGTIQSLYASGLALEDVKYTIGKDPELACKNTQRVMQSLNETIAEIRHYILDLRDVTENAEFEMQLRATVQDFAARAGIEPKITVVPDWRRPFTAGQSSQLLLVARESLANIVQHAAASSVEVVLVYGRETATLEIRDNGRGFDPDQGVGRHAGERGNGIHNMCHRLELLGGGLRIDTNPGQGTRVLAEIPYVKEETSHAAHPSGR